MGVVDFHTHFFSRPFFEALATASPQPGSNAEKLARLADRSGVELPPDDVARHWKRWAAALDAHDVEHVVSFASLPPEAPALAQAAALARGRMTPMALVDPTADGAAARARELVLEGPFGGVLLFPALHHFHPGGAAARGVLAVLNEARALCYVHCGMLVVKLRDLLGLPRPYDLAFANPLGVIPAANAFPEACFVIPHFGAGFLRETLMAGTQCENVYVDTSSTNSWIRTQPGGLTLRDAFARALDVFGDERVLFGTDSGVFPAGWRAERLVEQRAILDELGLDAAGRARVLGDNARGLLARVARQ
jgi:hypothetical protein